MREPKVDYRTRFYSKVKKTEGCWLWTGAAGANGYGVFSVGRQLMKAHRFAYLLENGRLVGDICVLHRCDNRKCVNPSHLFLGTHRDNALDMHAKGRGSLKRARGEQHAGVKLCTADVLTIRSSREPRKSLAERFRVSINTIAAVRARRIWAHV